ncbi:MAG: hypothetical protein ACI8RD_005499 [Bacillariaceae sp.]|jgi:hypothetical protein
MEMEDILHVTISSLDGGNDVNDAVLLLLSIDIAVVVMTV